MSTMNPLGWAKSITDAIRTLGLEAAKANGHLPPNIVLVNDEFNAVYMSRPLSRGGYVPTGLSYLVNYIFYFDPKLKYFIFVKSRSHDPTTEMLVINELIGVEVIPHPSHPQEYTFKDEEEELLFILKGLNDNAQATNKRTKSST